MCMARTPNTPPQAGRTGSGRPTTGGVREPGDAPVAAKTYSTNGATRDPNSGPASGRNYINSQDDVIKGGFLGLEDKAKTNYSIDQSVADSQSGGYKDAIAARMAALGKGGDPEAYQKITAQQAGQSDFRNNQKQLADLLYQQAMGQGPSAAQSQLQLANDKAINAQMSMARSGGNPAAMRQAMFNAATLTQQNAGEAASLRANEMMAGRQLYGNQLQGMRGADETLGMFNAGQGNQVGIQNASNFQNAVQSKEQLMQQYIRDGATLTEADRAADMQIAQINLGAKRGDADQKYAAGNVAGNIFGGMATGAVSSLANAGISALSGVPQPPKAG